MAPRCPILARFDALRDAEPQRVAVRAGDVAWTRTDLDALAREIGAQLHGLPTDSAVALAAPGGAAFFAGFLAIRRAGLAALLVDPTSPRTEQRRIAAALGASATLLATNGGLDATSWSAAPAHDAPEPRAGCAVIKLTSGTTGAPRGVAASAASVVADCLRLQAAMGLSGDDAILGAVPMSFSYGFSSVALPVLLCGNQVVLPPESPLGALHPSALGAVDFVPTTPAVVHAMSRLGRKFELPDRVRLVITAGSPLRPAHARAFRERFGRAAHVFYGASECGGICFDAEGGAAERGTVGAPLPGVEVTLEDEGRVVVHSDAVADGYVDVPAGVADDSTTLGGGTYRTGDLGVLRDGELALLGRRADRVVVAGRKIDLAEIEMVLLRADGVGDACVIARAGSCDEREVCRAFVTPTAGATLDPEAVLAFCRGHLAPHKIPRTVQVVAEIPRTERGKPDRDALAASAATDSRTA